MKKFLNEFKEFAFKGNIFELSIAVIMGAAFGAVVTGFVTHIITPLLALLVGKADFSTIVLGPLQIGSFINVLVDFLLKALAIFFMVKIYNKITTIKKQEEADAIEENVVVNEELETLKAILAELKNK